KRDDATGAPEHTSAREALELLVSSLEEAERATRSLIERADELAQTCMRIFNEMDFKFLLDPERKVFVIGYNVSAGRCDNSYYDLLASEARLASFVAIAKGDVQQEHWFRLGRQLTPVDGQRALISWTATMFEYLMPLLVMRDFERTLLDETYHAIIARQIEYGAERLPQNQRHVLIRAFMAHHQGMSLVALDNLLRRDVMQRRFHAEPLVQATELLLQERIPRGIAAAHPRAEEVLSGRVVRTLTSLATRVYDTPDLPTPRTQLLSNGTYAVMLTTAGAGYSACAGLAVTRWREDATRDSYGSVSYLRDVRRGTVWAAGPPPTGRRPETYEVTFSEDKVDFWRSDLGVGTHMEIIVTPEDNAELRRLSLTNQSTRVREIEVTS